MGNRQRGRRQYTQSYTVVDRQLSDKLINNEDRSCVFYWDTEIHKGRNGLTGSVSNRVTKKCNWTERGERETKIDRRRRGSEREREREGAKKLKRHNNVYKQTT